VINGSIQVTGDGGNDVRLHIDRTIEAEREQFVDEARRDVRLDTMDGADTVGLVVREPHGAACGEPYNNNGSREPWWDRARYRVRTDVTVHVPAAIRFRVCGINSKDVDIAGVTGDFDVTNVNGPVRVQGVRGSGRATTVNGAVTVTFLEGPRDESLLKTVNGDITATFPSSLSADLKLKTFHGGLFTDFDVTPVAARPTTAPDRRNGRYVYRMGGFTTRARRTRRPGNHSGNPEWRRARRARHTLRGHHEDSSRARSRCHRWRGMSRSGNSALLGPAVAAANDSRTDRLRRGREIELDLINGGVTIKGSIARTCSLSACHETAGGEAGRALGGGPAIPRLATDCAA
jgi:hypothetical protein